MKRHGIVVPSFNSSATILETLSSIEKANVFKSDIIVVDNASTDGTPDLVRRDFPHIRLVVNKENMYVRSHPAILDSLRGDYRFMSFYHSDDIYGEGIIKESLLLLEKYDAAAVSFRARKIDAQGVPLADNLLRREYGNGNIVVYPNCLLPRLIADDGFVLAPSVTFNLEYLLEAGNFDPKMGGLCDTEMWLRLNQKRTLIVSSQIQMDYRIHPNNDSKAQYFGRVHPRIGLLREWTLLDISLSKRSREALLAKLEEEEAYERFRQSFFFGQAMPFNPLKSFRYLRRQFKVNLAFIFKSIAMFTTAGFVRVKTQFKQTAGNT